MTAGADSVDWRSVAVADGALDAYWVKPDGAERAIILLHEIFGVNRPMRKLADWFATQGYLVVVPDLFWRFAPHLELGYSEAEIAQAIAYSERLDGEKAVADIAATADFVRAAEPGLRGVHLFGLCLGGRLAVAGAAGFEPTSAVALYGVGIEPDMLARLRSPVQMHFGDHDKYVSKEAIEQIAVAPRSQPVEIHVYEGAGHGFFNPARPQSDTGATALAWERARAFMNGS